MVFGPLHPPTGPEGDGPATALEEAFAVIDATDRKILSYLQSNARIPAAEIARNIDLAASAVHHRIRKLEEAGVIQGYETRIDPRAVDRGLVSFVRVQTGEGARAPDLTEALAAIPEVQEVHRVVGEDCFFVKVRVSDPEALADLLDHRLQRIPNVASTHTTIVLTTAKETLWLPVESAEDRESRSVYVRSA
jgi:Lrp/AsnC family transcriptional regulator, leucine-responsive regulatory protein